MTPKTEKPKHREFFITEFPNQFEVWQPLHATANKEKANNDAGRTGRVVHVIDYQAVTELERRLNLANSNYDSIYKACNEWEQSCYRYVKLNNELEQKIKEIESSSSIITPEKMRAADLKIKSLESENAVLMQQSTTRMNRVLELEAENQKLREDLKEATYWRDEAKKWNKNLSADVMSLKSSNKTLAAKLKVAEDKNHVLQCGIDEVFNRKHLRNMSVLTSNPPQNGGVFDLQSAVVLTMSEEEANIKKELAKVGEK